MKRAESVLLFNFEEGGQLKAIRMALFLMQVEGKLVKKEEYMLPLKLLLDKESIPAASSSSGQQELKGQMIVFVGLGEEKLTGLLSLLRSNPECGEIPYKAILTDTNKEWNAYALMHELQKEHAAVLRRTV